MEGEWVSMKFNKYVFHPELKMKRMSFQVLHISQVIEDKFYDIMAQCHLKIQTSENWDIMIKAFCDVTLRLS